MMRAADLLRLTLTTLWSDVLRSALTVLGIAIGIAAVLLLTAIGEGTHAFVLDEFTQFGTNVIAINPGRAQTVGVPGVLGGTTHPLTVEDAEALERIPGVRDVLVVSVGTARVEANGRGRSVLVYGANDALPTVMASSVRQGRFLPAADPRRPSAVAVLGPTLKRELFGEENALGRTVRVGGRRFRVIGVMASKGQFLGIDIDDTIYVPVGAALDLFHLTELFEIDVVFAAGAAEDRIVEQIRAVLRERHRGADDVTITTQADMLSVLDSILGVLTKAVGAIGAVSLLVGAIGILTVMWIAVHERTAEIGLLRALGAGRAQITLIFLGEATLLGLAGGVAGILLGLGVGLGAAAAIPNLPFRIVPAFGLTAIGLSLVVGLLSGVLPARRAAGLDPTTALRAE